MIYILLIFCSLTLQSQNKIEILYKNAVNKISLGHIEEGKKIFLQILKIEPAFFPDENESPKIKSIFFAAKNFYYASYKSNHEIILTTNYEENFLIFNMQINEIKSKISNANLMLKHTQDSCYIRYTMNKLAQNKYKIKLKDIITEDINYYIEVVGEYGLPFVFHGSAMLPFIIFKKQDQNLSYQGPNYLKSGLGYKIKEGWPLIMGAGIFVISAIAFSFLKINV